MLSRLPFVTYFLLGISAFVFVISGYGTQLSSLQLLLYSYYTNVQFYEIKQFELWRLLTPIFIHFSVYHLGMNGVMIWVFGRLIEAQHQRRTYLTIIIVIAMVSNTAQYLVSGPLFGGLSGVLYGLLGFIWAMSRFSPGYPLVLPRQFVNMMLFWFFLCWSNVLSAIGLHVANTAHTAGLITGLICGYVLAKKP